MSESVEVVAQPQESISSILSSTAAPEPVASTPATASATGEKDSAPPADKQEEKQARARDEAGKFAKTEAQADQAEVKVETKPRADVAAIIDERRKRQALEKEVADLKAQSPKAKPSIYDNEDEAINVRVDERTRPLREALYNQSMRYARQSYGDEFASAEQAFMEAAEANPGLYEGLRGAADPGEYVYLHGTFHKEMSDVGGNILKYRDKVTADTSAKVAERDTKIKALEAEVERLAKANKDLETLPRSLNDKSSSASLKASESDDEDIRAITRFGNKQR